MIDLHSHLIPGIDDGSRSVERSLRVLRNLAEDGVEHVVLTPHVSANQIALEGERWVARRAAAFLALQERASDEPRLHLGFEIMLDEPLPELATGDRRFALAGSRYYLVEFPLAIVAEFAATVLRHMAQAGVTPLVAHPERYDACSPRVVEAWRDAGARIQVDATALTRPTRRGRRARALVAEGLADVVAADNHGDRRTLLTARRYLERRGHAEAARRLTETNPRAVLDDGPMVEVPPAPMRETLVDRLRRFVE